MSRKAKNPVFDDDNPESTKADFARATKVPKGIRLKGGGVAAASRQAGAYAGRILKGENLLIVQLNNPHALNLS